jgi:hypothetical protein
MPQLSRHELIDRRLSEADPENSARFFDLALVVMAEDAKGNRTDEVLLEVGGRWDRRLEEYVGDADRVRVLSVHLGQLEPMRFFADWLRGHVAGEPAIAAPSPEPGVEVRIQTPDGRIYSAMLAGGVRSGKTWEGVLWCVAYAVACPGSIVWIVCPSDRRYEEVEDLLRVIMPLRWYSSLGAPWFRWKLANGSKIVLRSGHDPEALKVGDADFLLINEAQQQAEKVFAIARGRIAASGGLVVVAANPPDKPIGTWVGDFATEAQAGMRQARFFHVDPFDNPHIDHGPLLAMAAEFDEHTVDVEIRGKFLGAKNAVFYNWDRSHNERPPGTLPGFGVLPEITREFLLALEGAEFDRAVGVDMQRLPHMTSGELRIWENPLAMRRPGSREWLDWALGWFTADVTIAAAEEADLCQSWLDLGWDPDRTLIIADASGKWQFGERDPTKVRELREQVRGRGSWDVFRRFGFVHVRNPDRNLEKNPDVIERVRAMQSRICTKAIGPYGQRYLFADPRLRELTKAIRLWPYLHGRPAASSQYAHRCDWASYLCQRFWPRRSAGDIDIKVVSKPDGRRRMMGW